MNNNFISVIMSTYKEDISLLKIAIESIINQTCRNFEYLIAIDAPDNEELIAVVREYERQDDRIRVIYNEQNMGLVASLNKLLECAKGDYIARMDADDYSYPERLKKQLEYAIENDIDIMSGFVRVVDEKGNELRLMNKLPLDNTRIRNNLKYNNCMPHPAWFVKAKVYRELKGYNNIPYCEDYDFVLRAREEQYKFANYGEILFDYRMTTSSISRSNLYRQYISMNYVLDKYVRKKTVADYEQYFEIHYREKSEKPYCECAGYLSEALSLIKQKQHFRGFCKVFKAFWGSREYRKKMWAYLLQEIR